MLKIPFACGAICKICILHSKDAMPNIMAEIVLKYPLVRPCLLRLLADFQFFLITIN